jgi:hypothetical protein
MVVRKFNLFSGIFATSVSFMPPFNLLSAICLALGIINLAIAFGFIFNTNGSRRN